MQRIVLAGIFGLIFGTGIAISGMANPAKVLNFFDVAGTWDASLLLVMGSALAVTAIGYRFVLRRDKPVCESRFHLPTSRKLDVPLIAGSAVFGIGWGIAGFCPGGAIPALGMLRGETLLFVAAVIAGIVLARAIKSRLPAPAAA